METLQTVLLDKKRELARYRLRPDAKPYVINKLEEQIKALENCVDLSDSGVDNQLLILLRNTLWQALCVEDKADVLIVGLRLTDSPTIRTIDLADLVYTKRLRDPQTGLYELLEIERCNWEAIALGKGREAPVNKYVFHHIVEGLNDRPIGGHYFKM